METDWEFGVQPENMEALLKAIVLDKGEVRPDGKRRLKISQYALEYAHNFLPLSIYKLQDPRMLVMEIQQVDEQYTSALKEGFGNNVPEPNELRKAIKKLYGYDI